MASVVSVDTSTDSSRWSQRSSLVGWSFFLVSLAVLTIVVPGYAVAAIADTGRSSAWTLSVAVMMWSGLRLSLLIGSGEARFFAFFFWLFTYIFMGVAPTVQIRSNELSTTTLDVLPSADALMMWTVIGGLACFEVGVLVSRRSAVGYGSPGGANAPRRESHGFASDVRPLVAVGLALAGIGLSAYYVSKIGIAPLVVSREAANTARAQVWPDLATRAAVITLSIYLTLIGTGGLIQLRRAARGLAARFAYLILVILGLATLLVIVFPVSTARFTLGTVLFALVILFGGAESRARRRLTFAATVFGLFFIFPLADAFRTSEVNFSRAGLLGEYAGNPDYDSVWQVSNAIDYWYGGAAVVGRQALGLVLFWVPRSTWLDKPVDTGVLLANENGYTVTNLSAPVWAEAFVNGGFVALILVFVALGFLLRRLDDRVGAAIPIGGLWVVVGAVFPGYMVILLRGSLLQATGTVVIILLCLLVLRRAPQPARRSAP